MYRFAAVLLLLGAALPAFAADRKFDADAKAKAVAPFVDDRTVVVLHVDLDAIDLDALLKKAEAVVKIDPAEKALAKAGLGNALDTLKKAGAHDYYLVVSLADLPAQGPFSVIPVDKNGDPKQIAKVVGQLFGLAASEELGGAVVVGGDTTLKRLAKLKPTPRPEIAKAFAASGDGAVHVVAVATTDTRKILEEMMPNLPPEIGGGSIKVLTRGLQWAALKVEIDPQVNFQLIVQASDNAAAKELLGLLTKAMQVATKEPNLQEILKQFPQFLETFTPKVQDDRLVLRVEEKTLVTSLAPVVEMMRAAAFRMQSTNNMKQLVLAMHSTHDAFGAFPAAAISDKKGKALLSWRVHILPFIEQDKLYKEFHLDEPWDSEHNIKLVKKMPKLFASSANAKLAAEGKTTYLGVVGSATMFTGEPKGVRIADVIDGTSNTIFLVDAADDQAVIWSKPEDLKLDPKDPHKGISDRFAPDFLVALVDGSVHLLPKKIDKETLNALFTRNGGEAVTIPK